MFSIFLFSMTLVRTLDLCTGILFLLPGSKDRETLHTLPFTIFIYIPVVLLLLFRIFIIIAIISDVVIATIDRNDECNCSMAMYGGQRIKRLKHMIAYCDNTFCDNYIAN